MRREEGVEFSGRCGSEGIWSQVTMVVRTLAGRHGRSDGLSVLSEAVYPSMLFVVLSLASPSCNVYIRSGVVGYVVINTLSRVAPCCLLSANEVATSNQIADQGVSYGAAWCCCEVELGTEIAVVLTPTKWAIAETASAQCLSWPPRVDTAIASTTRRVGVQELGSGLRQQGTRRIDCL